MRKSLGNKRNFITDEQIQEITSIYTQFAEGKACKIFDNDCFGYTKITVEQPLREHGAVVKDRQANPKPN